jgi:hypothetical protein
VQFPSQHHVCNRRRWSCVWRLIQPLITIVGRINRSSIAALLVASNWTYCPPCRSARPSQSASPLLHSCSATCCSLAPQCARLGGRWNCVSRLPCLQRAPRAARDSFSFRPLRPNRATDRVLSSSASSTPLRPPPVSCPRCGELRVTFYRPTEGVVAAPSSSRVSARSTCPNPSPRRVLSMPHGVFEHSPQGRSRWLRRQGKRRSRITLVAPSASADPGFVFAR